MSADLPRGAFALALRRLAVFELIPGDKRPLHKGGYKTASNERDLDEWLDARKRHSTSETPEVQS